MGCAIAYPLAKKLHSQGAEVHSVVGFRNKGLVILEKEFEAVSDKLCMMTDDGSYGQKGLVTQALEELILAGNEYEEDRFFNKTVTFDQEIRDQDHREHEPDYDRRNRDVRRMPFDSGRPDEICLCGRTGL